MPNNPKITVLSDNLALPDYECEHGFALHLKLADRQILMDAGCDAKLMLRNAERAGLSLEQLDCLVISHGHYDHVGAVASLLELSPELQIFAHPNILKQRYSIRNQIPKDIAVPANIRRTLENCQNKRSFRGRISLFDGVELFNEIPRTNNFEDTGGPFFCDKAGEVADPIEDETVICIRSGKELLVLSGCSHTGIVNILQYMQQQYPDCIFRAVIGGLHLVNADAKRLQITLHELKRFAIANLIACHCSGEEAMRKIADNIPGANCFGAAGKQWQF
ncbi:MAG: MBL fold metallo-hydrolase [Oligosphaeraceae bacterium]|mgnify:FL=1|nr:MBL fold metallo-hydrolase [Oligosphaeraceae bacterium]